jgi:multiple sugar transport system permease protein
MTGSVMSIPSGRFFVKGAVVAGTAALGLGLSGGCDRSRGPDRTTLTVWGTTLGPNDQGQIAVVREFERRNPGVKVRTLGMGSGGMNPQKLMTAIVGGAPPDVVYQDRFTLSDWAARGAFQPLDSLIERDRGSDPTTPTRDQYYAAPWDEATHEGRIYGVPWMSDTRILYWNKAVFRERAGQLRAAGLDPDRPPRTWSETLRYSRALTEFHPDGSLKRAGFIPFFGDSWFTLFALQNEAPMFSPDGRRCVMDNPASAEALRFIKDAYDVLGGIGNTDRFQASFRGEERSAFFVGQVAMVIDGDWNMAGLAKHARGVDYGVAPPPSPDDRVARKGRFVQTAHPWITWCGGFAYSIPRGAKQVEWAWKFIKFVTSFEGRMLEIRAKDEANRERGIPSVPRVTAHVRTNAQSLAEILPKDPALAAAATLHMDMMRAAVVRPVSVAGKKLWDEQNRAADLVLRGLASPEEALRRAQSQVQSVLDEHNGRLSRPLADVRSVSTVGLAGLLAGGALAIGLRTRRPRARLAVIESRWGWLFVAPWVVGFVAFTLGPMVASLVLSFAMWNGLQEARWVGLQNYRELFGPDGGALSKSLSNVLYLAAVGVPLGLATSLSVALLLNSAVRGIRFYRAVFYLPSIVPGIASAVLWVWILNPDPQLGLFNGIWAQTVGSWFAVPPPGWFSSEEWAKPALVMMGLWGAGSGAIVWLAGLKGVPTQLYEATAIDGAGPWRQFMAVTLPHLSPLVFFNVVVGFIGTLQTFEGVYVVTNGVGSGPNDALLVPVYHLFVNAFAYFRLGYASALAWVLFLVVMAVTALQFWASKRWVRQEAEDD